MNTIKELNYFDQPIAYSERTHSNYVCHMLVYLFLMLLLCGNDQLHWQCILFFILQTKKMKIIQKNNDKNHQKK